VPVTPTLTTAFITKVNAPLQAIFRIKY